MKTTAGNRDSGGDDMGWKGILDKHLIFHG